MKIGIDIMGGDFAPTEIVLGAIKALETLPPNVKLTLIGDKEQATQIVKSQNIKQETFEYIHTTQTIEMGEHPAKAFAKKTDSSIAVGFDMLQKKLIDGFASAGNTGAMLVGAMYTIKAVPGVIRPSIAATIPQLNGGHTLLLDVGLNADCKPDVLNQYGILGSKYAEKILNIKNPKVGLLNIGSEEEKGNLVSRSAHELMKDTKAFNFIGNVEGTDIFNYEKVNVIVCDGFVGNIVLKEAESFYSLIKKRNIKDEYFEKFNFENFGGTPILGVNAPVIIAHGVSKANAIKNMIKHTYQVIESKLVEEFKIIFQ